MADDDQSKNSPRVFEAHYTIRNIEMDAYGHLNNAVYFQYYDESRWLALRELGYDQETVRGTGKGFVTVDAEMKWKKEVKALDEIKIVTSAMPIDSRVLMKLHQRMIRVEDNVLLSDFKVRLGLLNLKRNKLERLPTDVIEWFGL